MNVIDVAQVMYEAGFRGQAGVVGLAVIGAESAYDPAATYNNPASATSPVASIDRGLWQINDYWHKEVSDECAFGPLCASKEAFRISLSGANYNPWNAFKSGAHLKYMLLANTGWEAAKRIRALQGRVIYETERNARLMTELETARIHMESLSKRLDETLADLETARVHMESVSARAEGMENRIHAFASGLVMGAEAP